MAKRRLNDKDIDQLLNQYRSERRRLIFQLENVRQAIADLKGSRDGTASAAVGSRGPTTRRSAAAKSATRRKPGRRKKREIKNGGYRLSDWDNMVVTAISNADRLLPKEELMKSAMTWAKKHEPSMKEADVEAKLTRVLQKLSGKRGVLGTHRSGLRRGYHYGVRDWFFASSGKLRKQHLDKLVLTKV